MNYFAAEFTLVENEIHVQDVQEMVQMNPINEPYNNNQEYAFNQ